MLSWRGDVETNNSNAISDACSDGVNIYAVSTFTDVRTYDLKTLALKRQGTTSSGLTGTGITLVAPATAVVSYTSANIDFIDLNTGARTNITTNTAATTSSNYAQQVCGNPVNGLALATRSSALTFINSITKAASSINPSNVFTSPVAQNSNCIVLRPDNNNWLVGTSKGQIIEVTPQGGMVDNLSLPPMPTTGAVQTTAIMNLSYSAPNIAFCTDRGDLYVYNWSTKALIAHHQASKTNGSLASVLCQASSGVTLLGKGHAGASTGNYIAELYFETKDPVIGSPFYNETNQPFKSVGIDPTTNIAWLICNNSTFMNLRTFDMTPTQKVNVDSRFQDPPGTDVTARIIRLRDAGIGKLAVESSTTITGKTNISCQNGVNYIEIGIESGTKFDVREFLA